MAVTMEAITEVTTEIMRMIANTAARIGVVSSGRRVPSARHAPRRCRPGSVFVPDAARISDAVCSVMDVEGSCRLGRPFARDAARRPKRNEIRRLP